MDPLRRYWLHGAMFDPTIQAAQRRRVVKTLGWIALMAAIPDTGERPTEFGGELRIVGSRAMIAPVEQWTALFRHRYPGVRIHSALYGDGLAAGAIAEHRADIAPLSRPMRADERAVITSMPPPVAVRVATREAANLVERKPVYLYIARNSRGKIAPVALAYARLALSRAGQASIAGPGFEALSARQLEASIDTVARLMPASQAHTR